MPSRPNLLLAPALLALAFLFMPETCWGEETLPSAITESDVDAESDDADADKHSARKTKPGPVDANGYRLPEGPLSLAQVTQTTERVVVHGFDVEPPAYPALPEVEGTRINSGKKTSFVKPTEFPEISNNNYREVLATTPGLLVSEEPNSPVINFGYRGLDSQRAETMQLLKDGISIKNEQFGFPETHYTPVLDAVERIEFIRAGAALQFGPQPGGALNFIMKMPRKDAPFHATAKALYGSDELFQAFLSFDGTVGQFGYYAYYDHRQRDGFRVNSDYDLNNGSVRLVFEATSQDRFILTLDAYDEEHGEPGGLRTFIDPAGIVMGIDYNVLYQDDRNASSRFFDRFRLQRYYADLAYQHLFSESTQLEIKAFGGYLSRYSKRQRGGGVGILPNGAAANTNSIQNREVWNEGVDVRVRHDYQLAGDTSTFTGGVYFYHAQQDRTDERGSTPDADSGMLRNFATGETTDFSIFAENRFHFGRLSVTPGMRLEFLNQTLDETFNFAKANNPPALGGPQPLASRDDDSFVPLFSLGLGYVLMEGQHAETTAAKDAKDTKNMTSTTSMVAGGPPRLELYGTVAQAYRPRTYGELVPTSATGLVNDDLKEGNSLQFELGLRGKPFAFLTFDVSVFHYTFDDQVGDITLPGNIPSTANVGDARYVGFEAGMELDILAVFNGGTESPYGRLNLYGNVTLLDAEFTAGPNNGLTPAYAPDYQFKVGAIYSWKDRMKAALIGTIVDDHFANATNSPTHFVPAYTVWDLTAEYNFCQGRFGVFAGIGNVFDEDFWGEVRDEGILPAARRNYYGGLKIRF
ncbi:MAG: TonB-dependent receptor plug domain-containing protein [Chthoniobacterales bacterium]